MSYRNDHDAALARIDALESELGKSADARARFASLEDQLTQAKRERDRALAEGTKKTTWLLPTALALAAVGVIGGIGLAANHAAEPVPERVMEPAPPAPIAKPVVPTERTKLLACVGELDGRISHHEPSSTACLATLGIESRDAGLGDDIHATLVKWRDAEAATRWSDRAALGDQIHAYIVPSFTR